MRITCDEPKRLANIEKHGFDLPDAVFFGWEHARITPTYPGADGRPRLKAIGQLHRQIVAVIYSPLGTEAISVISLRPAHARERTGHAKD